MRTVFGPEGELRGTDILAGIVALWRESASGTLQFSRSGATAGFDFAAGEIIGASSSDPRFDTAAILVRAGKLEASTLERIAATEGADRAMTALQAGVLTKREWRWGEKIRAVEIFSDLLTWIEGDYRLYRLPPREAGEFRLTIPRLVLELFLRSRDRGLVLHHLGGVDVPLVRDSRFESEFATFGLTDDAESVVRLIDGESTAAEIASEAPAEAFAVEKLLAALVTLGLVHPAYATDAGSPAARPSPPPAAPESREPELRAEGEEELEPEVDIEEKVEAQAAAAPTGPEEEERGRELAGPEGGAEELSEAPLASSAPEEAEGEVEALADFEAEAPGPPDLAGGEEQASAFDRPLDLATGIGAVERPPRRSLSPLVWLLIVLAAVTGAILYWRSRGPGAAFLPAAAPATESPAPAEEPGVSATSTPPPPAAVAPPGAATEGVPAVATIRRASEPVASTRATASVPTRIPAPVPASAATRQEWIERAERDRKRAASDRNARFTIQLELACELPSLSEAWSHDKPAGTMWVAASSFRGKTCFRVLWGRFPSREAAERARASAPAFFSTPRNRPMVVPIR